MVASGDVKESSHANLYQALKGGGNNFRVVTRFDFKTFGQQTFWSGFLILPTDNSKTQLEFVQNFTAASKAGSDDIATFESVHTFNTTGLILLAAIITYMKPYALWITNLTNLTIEVGTGEAWPSEPWYESF